MEKCIAISFCNHYYITLFAILLHFLLSRVITLSRVPYTHTFAGVMIDADRHFVFSAIDNVQRFRFVTASVLLGWADGYWWNDFGVG